MKELGFSRDLSRNPIFQVELTLLTPDLNPAVYGYGISAVSETVELQGLTMTPLEIENGIAVFDLSFIMWDMPKGIEGTVEYNTDLFEASTIARMIDQFETLLGEVVVQPEAAMRTLMERLNPRDEPSEAVREEVLSDALHQILKTARRKPIPIQR